MRLGLCFVVQSSLHLGAALLLLLGVVAGRACTVGAGADVAVAAALVGVNGTIGSVFKEAFAVAETAGTDDDEVCAAAGADGSGGA